MQYAAGAASLAAVALLALIVVWLLYDMITAYAARRRFARLQALRKFWLRARERELRPAPRQRN
jgi:hypothetical protein